MKDNLFKYIRNNGGPHVIMEENNLNQLFSDSREEIPQNIIDELLKSKGDYMYGFNKFENIKAIVCRITFQNKMMYLHANQTSGCEYSIANIFGRDLIIPIVYTFIMKDGRQIPLPVRGYDELQELANTLNNN